MQNSNTSTVKSDNLFQRKLPIEDFLPSSMDILVKYICNLCKGVFFNPVSDECGDIFCHDCILKSLEILEFCPVCNKDMKKESLKDLNFVNKIILKQKSFCTKKLLGCDWFGLLSERIEHESNHCSKRIIFCKDCKEHNSLFEGYPEELKLHIENNCPYKLIECENFCGELHIRCERELHFSYCPKQIIICPLNCQHKVIRKDIDNHLKEKCSEYKINCNFYDYGCYVLFPRGLLEMHNEEYKIIHNGNTMKYIKDFKSFTDSIMLRLDQCRENIMRKEAWIEEKFRDYLPQKGVEKKDIKLSKDEENEIEGIKKYNEYLQKGNELKTIEEEKGEDSAFPDEKIKLNNKNNATGDNPEKNLIDEIMIEKDLQLNLTEKIYLNEKFDNNNENKNKASEENLEKDNHSSYEKSIFHHDKQIINEKPIKKNETSINLNHNIEDRISKEKKSIIYMEEESLKSIVNNNNSKNVTNIYQNSSKSDNEKKFEKTDSFNPEIKLNTDTFFRRFAEAIQPNQIQSKEFININEERKKKISKNSNFQIKNNEQITKQDLATNNFKRELLDKKLNESKLRDNSIKVNAGDLFSKSLNAANKNVSKIMSKFSSKFPKKNSLESILMKKRDRCNSIDILYDEEENKKNVNNSNMINNREKDDSSDVMKKDQFNKENDLHKIKATLKKRENEKKIVNDFLQNFLNNISNKETNEDSENSNCSSTQAKRNLENFPDSTNKDFIVDIEIKKKNQIIEAEEKLNCLITKIDKKMIDKIQDETVFDMKNKENPVIEIVNSFDNPNKNEVIQLNSNEKKGADSLITERKNSDKNTSIDIISSEEKREKKENIDIIFFNNDDIANSTESEKSNFNIMEGHLNENENNFKNFTDDLSYNLKPYLNNYSNSCEKKNEKMIYGEIIMDILKEEKSKNISNISCVIENEKEVDRIEIIPICSGNQSSSHEEIEKNLDDENNCAKNSPKDNTKTNYISYNGHSPEINNPTNDLFCSVTSENISNMTILIQETNPKKFGDEKKEFLLKFDKINAPMNIEFLSDNRIKSIKSNKNDYFVTFIDFPLQNIKEAFKWSVNFSNITGWVGLGMCYKEKILENEKKFVFGNTPKNDHGTFLFSLNGFRWNTSCRNEDYQKCNNFPKININENANFLLEYNPLNKILYLKYCTFETKIKYINVDTWKTLVPCVVLFSDDTELEIMAI